MTFSEKLTHAVPNGIGLCIGLDPVMERIPEVVRNTSTPLLNFNRAIIEATSDIASAYKPNLAFYERYGAAGWEQLEETIRLIPKSCLIIADAKRGDIGSTAAAYADAIFNNLNADAVTVSPYLGSDSLMPFCNRADKGIYILCVTTNPSGSELQELVVDGIPLYRHVIRLAKRLNEHKNVGLVMGATKPELWTELMEDSVELPLLIPGIGTQGGDLKKLRNAIDHYKAPALINASRSIIYATSDDSFADAARLAAIELRDSLMNRDC